MAGINRSVSVTMCVKCNTVLEVSQCQTSLAISVQPIMKSTGYCRRNLQHIIFCSKRVFFYVGWELEGQKKFKVGIFLNKKGRVSVLARI